MLLIGWQALGSKKCQFDRLRLMHLRESGKLRFEKRGNAFQQRMTASRSSRRIREDGVSPAANSRSSRPPSPDRRRRK